MPNRAPGSGEGSVLPQETCDVLSAQAALPLEPGDAPAVRRGFEAMSRRTPDPHLDLEFERPFVTHVLQPSPSSQTVVPTQRHVRGALTTPVATIRTAFDHLPDGSEILRIRVVSSVFDAL